MPPASERTYSILLGMAIFVSAAALLTLGLTPEETMACLKEIGVGCAKLGFVLSKAFEERTGIGDMGHGVGVQDYDVVGVGCYARSLMPSLVTLTN